MSGIWHDLRANRRAAGRRRILSLFDDTDRMARFSVEADDMVLDFSKTNIDPAALDLLLDLARQCGVAEKRDAMFRGECINESENRAVLHTALRADDSAPLMIGGADVRPAIERTLQRMARFCEAVRSGRIAAVDGGRFGDVINIGIGGSDLGPAMAVRALAPCHDGPRCHFVSNVDSADIADTLRGLDPARTLVVVVSKTFTTTETMTNARTALEWLRAGLGAGAGRHLAAASTAVERTAQMGIDADRVFGFADWVGGRYSLWGPVGLALMLAVGPAPFRDLLAGGRAMDRHFRTAPMARNLPVLLGLVGIWHRNICGYPTRAIVPYDQRLARLPAYLQQLDMESNGKSVTGGGRGVARPTGPVVWGEPGTNGQHAFFQMLHQGTDVIPVEFLIAAQNHEPALKDHHDLLKASCLAQSEALMIGRSFDAAMEIVAGLGFDGPERRLQAAHRSFAGNRPSVTLAYRCLTPFTLGQIIALHEHRVLVEGAIWGINSFDQWGVELGKQLAAGLLPMIRGQEPAGKDPSTRALIARLSR